MQINPYLTFNGNCAEAFRFYEKALRGKIAAMFTHGESPAADQVPAAMRDQIMHARLVAGDVVLMGSDSTPYDKPAGISVSLNVPEPAEADRIFNALADGGAVNLPIQQTFWALRFGMLVDRFGIPWMINCEAGKS